jgi:hypothetical protein
VHRLTVLLLLGLVAGSVAGPTTAGSTRATLRLADEAPLAFSGAGFRANEHVRVVVVAGPRAAHWTTAGARGRFVVRFRGMYVDACRGFSATAIGDRGSRATYKRAPGECPAP